MTLWRYVLQEIAFRKTGFLLGLLSVSVAMTAWVGAGVLLRAHDRQTERILDGRERATQAEMARMEDDYRRIMRDLGHNVMIVPGGQNLAALRTQGHSDTTMPYAYVERLAQGRIETLNHLLPVLQRRARWPERDLEVLLSGTPGQIPVTHLTQFLTPDGRAYRNPIVAAIPPGELVLGYEVARALDLRAGDSVVLLGDSFRIRAIRPAEGTTDDMAVWCPLDWLQDKLGLRDRINLILALECICEVDALGQITAEVTRLIPGVQVLEFGSRVRARALARQRAAEAHRTAMTAERQHRQELGAAQTRLAGVLVPLAITVATVWMVFLFLGNVRERRAEIGVLRALGVREPVLLGIFLLKSLILGVAGAAIGFAAGHGIGARWAGLPLFSRDFLELIEWRTLPAALISAASLCVLAAWFPVVQALRRDPARVLCET